MESHGKRTRQENQTGKPPDTEMEGERRDEIDEKGRDREEGIITMNEKQKREKKMKYKLTKTFMIMTRKIIHCGMLAVLWIALLLLFAPCLLIFSVGDDGEITVWNFLGLVWAVIIWRVFKKMND